MELITSRSNPLLAHMRKLLKSRSYRRTCNEGISDGVKLLEEAIRWQAPLTAVVLRTQPVPSCRRGYAACKSPRTSWLPSLP